MGRNPYTQKNQSPRVNRRLFGSQSESDDNFFRTLEEDRDLIVDKAMAKWNFDFRKGKPLDGKYLWEKYTKRLASGRPIGPRENKLIFNSYWESATWSKVWSPINPNKRVSHNPVSRCA